MPAGNRRCHSPKKRRRDLEAAIVMLYHDDNHRRNIDDAAAKKAYVAYSDRAAALLHGDDGLLYHEGADAHAAFPRQQPRWPMPMIRRSRR